MTEPEFPLPPVEIHISDPTTGLLLQSSSLKSSARIPELDGLRGVAILMVLVWHYFSCLIGPVERGTAVFLASRLATLTWSGVDLFFVLSGFLIGGILIDNFGKQGFVTSFLLRRFFRIAPAYFLFLMVYAVAVNLLSGDQYAWTLHNDLPFGSYLLQVQNFFMAFQQSFGSSVLGVTWSLAVEEQFYCMIILLFILLGGNKAARVLVLMGLAAPVLRILMPGFHTYVILPFRMDALGFGFAVSIALRSPGVAAWCEQNVSWIFAAALLLLFGVGAATWKGGMGELQHSFLAVFYAVVLLLVVLNTGSRLTIPLRFRALSSTGLYSYGIYLYHQFILGVAHGYILESSPSLDSMQAILVTAGSLIATFIVAAIAFNLVEARFIGFGRRFRYEKLSGAALSVAGTET